MHTFAQKQLTMYIIKIAAKIAVTVRMNFQKVPPLFIPHNLLHTLNGNKYNLTIQLHVY